MRIATASFSMIVGSVAYVWLSGAPARVHAVTLPVLFFAFWIPAVFFSSFQFLKRFGPLVFGYLCVVTLAWQWGTGLVVAKAEFLWLGIAGFGAALAMISLPFACFVVGAELVQRHGSAREAA